MHLYKWIAGFFFQGTFVIYILRASGLIRKNSHKECILQILIFPTNSQNIDVNKHVVDILLSLNTMLMLPE
jgi:hypothetical protein